MHGRVTNRYDFTQRTYSQANSCRPPECSHIEKTGCSCYAPAHIVHPSKEAITRYTDVHIGIFTVFRSDMNMLMSTIL